LPVESYQLFARHGHSYSAHDSKMSQMNLWMRGQMCR
jgi:hypothetical protein